MMMGYGGFGYGGGMGLFSGLFGLILIAGVVYLVIYLVGSPRHHDDSGSVSSAREIAAQRFARGEITEEEYERIIKNL